MLYVAVSRVRKLWDMIIEPLTLQRLQDVKNKKDFKYRKAGECKINDLAERTTVQKDINIILFSIFIIFFIVD